MPPLASAMTTFRQAVLSAFKSFLKGRSFLQALFAFWISPATIQERQLGSSDAANAFPTRSIEDFLKEAEQRFLHSTEGDGLAQISAGLKVQLRERMHIVGENMLPSFNHLLPSGAEKGQYLALDVGGSTLRVALVALRGRHEVGRESEIIRLDSFRITPDVKSLQGMAFFDWMAARINEVVGKDAVASQAPIPMGLAWSFPVNQTSIGGGALMGMGKGFLATQGLMGQDLGEIIQLACKKRGLDVVLGAIVNDGSATLLSQAYIHGSTRFGLILGTGTNISVHLPVSALSREKYGGRPQSWFEAASHVIVNTEVSMFGKGVLPLTRWDDLLNIAHPRPDFQPLEHLLSGYYLGEICRLVIVEAVESAGLFGGLLPPSLETPHSLDTETLSRIEADTSAELEKATSHFVSQHPSESPPSLADMSFIRSIASLISRRSAALLAASVFALWELRHETANEYINKATAQETVEQTDNDDKTAVDTSTSPLPKKAEFVSEAEVETSLESTKVAFNGSVIEHYPGYRDLCQNSLDQLTCDSVHPGAIELVPALESSLLGAAVALASAVQEQNILV